MQAGNSVFRTIRCGAFEVLASVALYRLEWEHIRTNHPTVALFHVVDAIERPVAIYEDHLRPGNPLFAGIGADTASGYPIRVAIKRLVHGNFVATAWYSGRHFKGEQVWRPEDRS